MVVHLLPSFLLPGNLGFALLSRSLPFPTIHLISDSPHLLVPAASAAVAIGCIPFERIFWLEDLPKSNSVAWESQEIGVKY